VDPASLLGCAFSGFDLLPSPKNFQPGLLPHLPAVAVHFLQLFLQPLVHLLLLPLLHPLELVLQPLLHLLLPPLLHPLNRVL
jgi:hypothetical protein